MTYYNDSHSNLSLVATSMNVILIDYKLVDQNGKENLFLSWGKISLVKEAHRNASAGLDLGEKGEFH